MKYLSLLVFALSLSSAWGQVNYVQPGKVLGKGGYEIKGTGRSWNSDSRFDQDGKETEYPSSEGFGYFEGEFLGRYGATNELQFTGGLTSRQNSADITVSGESETATSSGLQSIFAAAQYGFRPVGRINYSLEVFGRFMTYTNKEYDATTDDPTKDLVLGDDGPDFGGSFLGTWAHRDDYFLTAKLTYRRPGKEMSGEVNWLVEAAVAWRYFALVAGGEGIYSLGQDAYTDDPDNKPAFNTGGTNIYNGINREYIAPFAGLNIALGKTWRIEARYQQVLNATSYDTGSLITVSLARRVDSNQMVLIDKKFKEYDVEASIVKVSPKKQYVVIDKGLSDDIAKGQRFDIFHTDYLGGNILLGTGVVTDINADQSVVRITARYSTKFPIKEGTIVRGVRR